MTDDDRNDSLNDGGLDDPAGSEAADPTPDSSSSAEQAAAAGWYPDPTNPGGQRYWDGTKWAPPAGLQSASVPGFKTVRISDEERKQILAQQIQMLVVQGGRVESQSDFQAVIVDGKPVNHVLHAIITILTCLVWAIVWIILAATGGEKRKIVTVDDYGNVQVQRIG